MVKLDSSKFPALIIENFPWPLGSQILLLCVHESPGAERLEHLVSTYVCTSELLYYILLSNLWEQVKLKKIELPQPFDAGLPMDKSTFASFDFLAKTVEIYRIFHDKGVAPYVAEYEQVAKAWDDPAGKLQQAHTALEKFRAELLANAPADDFERRCLTAEEALSEVLKAAAFLARYRMLTVRRIAVEAPRFENVAYELELGPLNAGTPPDLKLYKDAENRRKTHYSNSHSIVLVRDENELDDCLNLSPFIVDKNTFVSVKKGTTPVGADLADIFILAYEEEEQLVYLSVNHSIRYALENERDRIHTDMTQKDFAEGRNLGQSASAPASEGGVKVFQMLRDQFKSCMVALGAAP
jgi:hypothetical protein